MIVSFYMTIRALLSGDSQDTFDIVRGKGEAPVQINELSDVETLLTKKASYWKLMMLTLQMKVLPSTKRKLIWKVLR